MKTLILHIGANKTGSSAIQEFLRLNAGTLATLGFAVAPSDLTPEGPITGQHVWFFEPLLSDIAAGCRKVNRRIDSLMSAIPDESRLVISAENLALTSHNAHPEAPVDINGAHALLAKVAQSYDTKIVLYIRRQDEFLLSSWQQWEAKGSNDLFAWLLRAAGGAGDWRDVLQTWETIVPREKIIVRLYERGRMPDGDVVADFAEVLGLSEHLPQLQRPGASVNPSYSEALVDLVKGNTAVFRDKHDNDFYNVVEQLTGAAYHRNPRESLITYAQRAAIMERYRESNEWVRKHYFPHAPAPLFALPGPDDYVVLGKDKLTQQKWEIVAGLIYRLARRVLR